MRIDFSINDQTVNNFTSVAKTTLTNVAQEYTTAIIEGAKRIEAEERASNGISQVTQSHVYKAVMKHGSSPQKNKKTIFIHILSEIFVFITGLMANPDYFIGDQNAFNEVYFFVFLLIFAIAITLAFITRFK